MRMSLHAQPNVRLSGSYFGYAYSYYEIDKSLRNYSYNGNILQVDTHSIKSNVQMSYASPPGQFYDHQYKIQMTQWESTLIPPSWVDLAKGYNEWWTANQFGADAFINAGVPAEKIHVYEHGVDSSTWTPKKRGQNVVIRFLHVDSGSPRKRADLVAKAFRAAFGGNINYELTLKYSHHKESDANCDDQNVLETQGYWETANIRHIKENMSLKDLVKLFHFHDVLVYPSEGEGFGLIPLQALATGMPVISTSRWCSYDKYFNGNIIDSTLGKSDIVETYVRHGDVVLPDLDSLVSIMKNVANNIEQECEKFYNQSEDVSSEYTWENKTKVAMDSLVNRIGIDMFDSYLGYLK